MNSLKRWIKKSGLQKKEAAAILGVNPNTITAMLDKTAPGGQCEAFLRVVSGTPDVRLEQLEKDSQPLAIFGDDPFRYAPADIVMSDGRRAADIVILWACQPGRSKENIKTARKFLTHWPDGPQLP